MQPRPTASAPRQQATRHPTRKRLTRAEREQQILVVAERVFAERGYQGVSMDDISHLVGLSKPMLYEYFGSKDGLLIACLERAKRELLEATSAAAAAATEPAQLMHNCFAAFFRFGDEHAQSWALLRNESAIPSVPINSGLEAIRRQQVEFTSALMQQIRPDIDTERLEVFAEALIGACERLALWREQHPGTSPEETADHLLALAGTGLFPPERQA
ncbi:TetR family transcriptional regulator [Allosaccharopolyspora coralli]|uniref:TetR family transcriptional regulator n=1 Tax=Allosaccharopolyspora coralli TaxID=2665642 RepID=A0A5Q3QID8_9PSEU|nr:TetR/AcrR family transcriptional regulator [Allosaccharopolyspora coralli]QGK71219.1 TetR family transcriptional regulator [Allosaccharopolyspora coralli]